MKFLHKGKTSRSATELLNEFLTPLLVRPKGKKDKDGYEISSYNNI